ncbi:glutaredoxin domain-containing protein [Chloroflexota bacterium]
MVKEFLSQKGVSYKEYDVSVDQKAASELVNRTGQMGVPVTMINGQTIIGFNQVELEQVLGNQHHPFLGATVADASKITAKNGTGIMLGAFVGRIRPGSLAERLSLATGDIITELNMQSIANANDLESILSTMSNGSHISLIYIRENKRIATEGIL